MIDCPYKPGDKLLCVDAPRYQVGDSLKEGEVYTFNHIDFRWRSTDIYVEESWLSWRADRFIPLPPPAATLLDGEPVYQPKHELALQVATATAFEAGRIIADLERQVERALLLRKSAEDRVAELIAERITWETAAKLNAKQVSEAIQALIQKVAPGDYGKVTLTLTIPAESRDETRTKRGEFVSGCAGTAAQFMAAERGSELNPPPKERCRTCGRPLDVPFCPESASAGTSYCDNCRTP